LQTTKTRGDCLWNRCDGKRDIAYSSASWWMGSTDKSKNENIVIIS